MSKDRGFKKLNGVTVLKVDAAAINEVVLLCSDGYIYTIESEIVSLGIGPAGIPKLVLTRRKDTKTTKVPEKSSAKRSKTEPAQPWPFPNGTKDYD